MPVCNGENHCHRVLLFAEKNTLYIHMLKSYILLSLTSFNLFNLSLKLIWPLWADHTEIFHDKTVIVTFSVLPPSPSDCPHLELIHFFSAGVNHVYKSPIYQHTDITLTTSSGIHGPQIAEWVIMTYLVQSHHYNMLYEKQKRNDWAKDSFASVSHQVRDLVGQRLGVLGYGSIGRQGMYPNGWTCRICFLERFSISLQGIGRPVLSLDREN